MASTTAPTTAFRLPPSGTPPLRQLWQVPTFVVGLVAFVAVCVARPPWHLVHASPESRALAELRELLKQREFNPDRALKLGAEAVRSEPDAAEAHDLLGRVYVAVAERAAPGAAADAWREGRIHLERARTLGVAPEDAPHLDLRLARAWAATGEAPARVIAALSQSIEPGAEDDAEAARAYELLADCYLKLPKPDLERALDATVKQIARSAVDEQVLAPVRLRRGELLWRLDRPDDALEVLRNIGTRSPPAVAARARRLCVLILEQQEQWAEAEPLWRAILADDKVPPPDRETVQYHLGLCLRHIGRQDEALAAWDSCLGHDGSGEEGPAAAVGAAELRLKAGQFEPALKALEGAVHGIKGSDDWHNSLVPLGQVRAVFEAGCKTAVAAGAHDAARQLARLYEPLAAPGRAQDLRGQAADAGARAALDRARAATPEAARQLYSDAEQFLRQAAEAHEQAAGAQQDPAERAERLWSAANDFLEAHEARRAAAAFESFLGLVQPQGAPPDRRFGPRLNEAWYKLGLARRDANLPDADAAFLAAVSHLEWPSRYVYRARYELAVRKREPDGQGGWRWTDQAEAELEQNLTQLRVARDDRDNEAREKTLYALGDIYFQRQSQRDALSRGIETLEEALRDFPDNIQALAARSELADCYRARADNRNRELGPEQPLTTEARLVVQNKVKEDRERAIDNFRAMRKALEARTSRDERDEHNLVYALWMEADTRYWAGGYEESADQFQALAQRLRGKKGFEENYFSALVNVVRGYLEAVRSYPANDNNYTDRVRTTREKVRQTQDEMRAALPLLDLERRRPFEDWLKSADPAGR
jgi:hypothetical protein